MSAFCRYISFEDDADKHLDRLFKLIASRENDTIRPKTLTIKERNVTFANTCGRVCDSTFRELCDRVSSAPHHPSIHSLSVPLIIFETHQPLGAIDYLTMSQVFHTVIIRNIPQMSLSKKTQCRRFITLIDTFYDNKVRVLFSAQVPPNQLFLTSEVADHHMDDDNRKLMDDLDIKFGTVCLPMPPQ
jgi:predicted ATPase